MADSEDNKAEASAEKAYAAAAESVADKPALEPAPISETPPKAEPSATVEPVEFPARPKRASKPKPAEAEHPAAVAPAAAPITEAVSKPRRVAAASNKVIRATKSAAKPAPKPAVKRAAAKPAAKAPKGAAPKVAPRITSKTVAPKIAGPGTSARPSVPFLAQLKDIPMDVTASIKDAVNGAQEKAKEAFTKTSAAATEYGEFAKGNVEAMVESGKILASGLQELGNGFVAESKAAFETATADVKALAGVKSPTDFFKLQTELLRRNFDHAVAYSTKTGEAMVKLTNDAFAPIGGRVSLAVEKIKKAA